MNVEAVEAAPTNPAGGSQAGRQRVSEIGVVVHKMSRANS
jgi:hypothetical protein